MEERHIAFEHLCKDARGVYPLRTPRLVVATIICRAGRLIGRILHPTTWQKRGTPITVIWRILIQRYSRMLIELFHRTETETETEIQIMDIVQSRSTLYWRHSCYLRGLLNPNMVGFLLSGFIIKIPTCVPDNRWRVCSFEQVYKD